MAGNDLSTKITIKNLASKIKGLFASQEDLDEVKQDLNGVLGNANSAREVADSAKSLAEQLQTELNTAKSTITELKSAVDEMKASPSGGEYIYSFGTGNWTGSAAAGYTITIPKSIHGLELDKAHGFYFFRHSKSGVDYNDTWAAINAYLTVNDSNGDIVLHSDAQFEGDVLIIGADPNIKVMTANIPLHVGVGGAMAIHTTVHVPVDMGNFDPDQTAEG